ncbi:extracellular solute-binding protein [Naumannella sp. ID2617S]|nr:extracellular solute-binding protein [Naumannella sp. ID2617S]
MFKKKLMLVATAAMATSLVLSGCGAGSRTGANTATKVECDFAKPANPVTVNVLAYNSSAVDPYTNTMVASCSREGVTVKHDPIDFAGQVQKTQATLGSEKGSYDIVETYSFVVPTYGSQGKLEPLDDLFNKYKDKYKLGDISPEMIQSTSYDGKMYNLPMQAQVHVMAYRKDILDKHGIQPPTNLTELRAAADKIQKSGDMKYPVALPWLASADIGTWYGNMMLAQGKTFVDPATKKPNFTSPEAKTALEEMKALLPYMDPQVTTFDQPKVQQQMYNGTAAISVMFSGRMNDLVQQKNSQHYDKIGFAPSPAITAGGKSVASLSVDGWSIPKNTAVDKDLLFQVIAASVSEDASKASVPAAFPARKGMATEQNSPYAKAANGSMSNVPRPQLYPYVPAVSSAITPIVGKVMSGGLSVDEALAQMQKDAEAVMAKN